MELKTQMIQIALAEDHVLLRSALALVVNKFDNCNVIIEASNGNELIKKIQSGIVPHLLLLDLNMPEFDGYETAKWLQANHPDVHILMLTMYDTEFTMIRLLQLGVRGFLKKAITTQELNFAIQNVMQFGYYYSSNTTGRLINLFRKSHEQSTMMKLMLSETEIRFLKYICSELTYKEIANEMDLNPRAVDNIRDNLFNKLQIKSRVGLAMYSLRHCIQSF
jgi:two-component system invasion response regulator UvrY